MTRYYYDCEFLENGKTIELISIGIVADDDRELYLINQGIEWDGAKDGLHSRICRHRWLMKNVIPHLPTKHVRQMGERHSDAGIFDLDQTDNRIVPLRYIRNAVRDFLTQSDGPIELWGYSSAYNHVLLMQLFGAMVDRPEGFPMLTNDVRQLAFSLGLEDRLPVQTGTAHNALDDARWTREAARYLAHEARERQMHGCGADHPVGDGECSVCAAEG